ncbi:MAG: hypothetical protein LN414_00700, partial [Candidatus Thermoplasmatota archaeon]|nr:hypothetical protein [Candidatus Thermoplasmatota archaeon]
VETVNVLIDGEPWRNFQEPPEEMEFVAQLVDGAHAVEIEVDDLWRNTASAWVEFEVDTTPPVISMDSPADGLMTNRTSVMVRGTVTGADSVDINGVIVELDGVGRFSSEFELAMEGPNELTVSATDRFGNLATASVSVVLDTTPPEIALAPTPALTNVSILVVMGQTDAVRVRVTPPGIDVKPSGNFSVEVHLEEGLNEVTIEAWDLVGNLAIKELSCILDTRIEFETVSPVNGATVDNVTVVVLCLTEEGLMLRIVDDTPGDWHTADEGGHINLTLELPLYGQNIFVFELQDRAGNTATTPYSLNRAGIPVEGEEEGSSFIFAIAAVLFLLLTASCIFLVLRRGEGRTA